jgi:hypothetical protein
MAQTEHPKPTESAELYLKTFKQRVSPTGEMLEKIKEEKKAAIDDAITDSELLRAQKNLRMISGGGVGVTNPSEVVSKIFQNLKTPEEIAKFLKDMTPEMLQNIQAIASALDSNQPDPRLLAALNKSGNNGNSQDMLIKYLLERSDKQAQVAQQQPQRESTAEMMKGLAELITALDKRNNPQSGTGSMSTMEIFKAVHEITAPIYDKLGQAERIAQDARLKELEAKMPGTLDEQIKYVKEMAPMLGLGQGGTNELDLKLEEMRQNREIDLKKLDWEQEKYKMESDNDSRK